MSAATEERVSMLERVLGRPEWRIPVEEPLVALAGKRILVTGAAGSIGAALVAALRDEDITVRATDIDTLDVRDRAGFYGGEIAPDVVFHLAGAKHAPDGETDPVGVMETNTIGTRNVLDAAAGHGGRVVLASTCKACDPETVYGASKLIAERMTLAAGGSVARFFNVVESSANVFETWRGLADGEPVPATHCERFFITLREAVALLLWSAVLPAGRYSIYPSGSRVMTDVASALHPGRDVVPMKLRRGDRWREPLAARSEQVQFDEQRPWLLRVMSPHEAGCEHEWQDVTTGWVAAAGERIRECAKCGAGEYGRRKVAA